MESYRSDEEQLEALKRWWDENGRSTIVAVIVALGLGFGFQAWKDYRLSQAEGASDLYQRMLQAFSAPALTREQRDLAVQLAQQIRTEFDGSTYAQFAALQLARVAVGENNLEEAEAQLRWVLGQADQGSDIARIAQLRLARVLAASGQPDQALAILDQVEEGPYKASYAVARGDILLSAGRTEAAGEAYTAALALAGGEAADVDLMLVERKLQALTPQPAQAAVTPDSGNAQPGPAAADTPPAEGAAGAGGEG